MVKVLVSTYYYNVLIDRYICNMSINQFYKYCNNNQVVNGATIEALVLD